MSALQFPCTIFKTQKKMEDYSASDMHCGDLSEFQLKRAFHLVDVSTRVNPYTLTKITPFNQPQSRFYGSHSEGEKISRQECAKILFDEFRHLSRTFSIYGPYSHLIEKMITHMQKGNGMPFQDTSLDSALKKHILNDNSKNNTRLLLTKVVGKNIEWGKGYFPLAQKKELTKAILRGKLPKFNRLQDSFNGMGITVHDVWATHIAIKSLHIENERYRALVNYKIQDHFGLDSEDISALKFNQFRFFRIWFLLQRYNLFGFKPFMTDMETTVEITGRRDEN